MRLLPLSAALLALALGCATGEAPVATPAPSPAPEAPPAAAPSAPAAAPTAAAPTAAPGARPLYHDRALTPADLDGRSLRELALMRNTIFARAGHPFVKPWLDAHFRAQPWYRPAAKADLSLLTDYDRANVAAIAKAEQAIGRDELLARRASLQARGVRTPEDTIELSLLSAALGEWSGDDAVPAAARNPLEDPTVLDGQLTLAQLEGLSPRDLRLVRNTVYARHGRPFQSPSLQAYFAEKAWYRPNAAYKDSQLTAVDKRNIQLVQSMEDRLGGPMREWEHQREEGWFEGA